MQGEYQYEIYKNDKFSIEQVCIYDWDKMRKEKKTHVLGLWVFYVQPFNKKLSHYFRNLNILCQLFEH